MVPTNQYAISYGIVKKSPSPTVTSRANTFGKFILCIILSLFSTSISYATWITKRAADGVPRKTVNNNQLGCDLAYITRYQPRETEGWRVQTLYNTRYQTGPETREKSSKSVGGHLKILPKKGSQPINLTNKLLGANTWRDVCDYDISYDASKIVLSIRNSKKGHWRLIEIGLDKRNYQNSTTKTLTSDKLGYDCIDPCYLPDGRIVFTANSKGTLNEYEMQLNELLHIMDPNPAKGKNPMDTIRQISFFQSGDYNPMIMNDGRLLWMRYEHHGIQDYFPLMSSRPDGTMVQEMFGFKFKGNNLEWNENNIRVFFEFTQLPEPDGRIISTAMWHFDTWEAGALVEIDPKIGPTDFKMPKNLTPPIPVTSRASDRGRFRTPYAFKDSNGKIILLAAYSHGPVSCTDTKIHGKNLTEEADRTKTPDFGIWKLKWTNREKTLLEPDYEIVNTKQEVDIDPQPILPQKRPPIIPTFYDETQDSGEFLCLNVYDNSLIKRAFEFPRKGIQRLRVNKADKKWESPLYSHQADTNTELLSPNLSKDATTIKSVRVIQGLPIYVLGNTHRRSSHYYHEPKRILGEVPVYADGSFRVRVPTGMPIHFQTLDKNRRVISTMRSWVYLNPTSKPMQTRFCVGCHEKRGHSAPNGTKTTIASLKKAVDLSARADDKFSEYHMHHFVRDVYPIIRKHCLPCHDNKRSSTGSGILSYKAPAGNIDLSDDVSPIYNVAYDTLRPWIRTDNAIRKSELLRMLTRARRVMGCGMPRAPEINIEELDTNTIPLSRNGKNKKVMDQKEWDTLVEWMELGAPFRFYGDGQVQTSLPAVTDPLSYKHNFGDVFSQNDCLSCHANYSKQAWHLNLKKVFTDCGGAPTTPGENSVNMSFPERSRLLRAPDSRDAGKNSRDQCKKIWTPSSKSYQTLFTAIKHAQDVFIGERAETLDTLTASCTTFCHDTEDAPKKANDFKRYKNKTNEEWKFTIMRMVMYVHRHGFRPASKTFSPLKKIGCSVRPPEAALVYKILTNYKIKKFKGTALELYNKARALRYREESNPARKEKATQLAIDCLWTARSKDPSPELDNLIRLELGVLFTQYLSRDMENKLFEAMQTSRPRIPEVKH